jgi:hypothetical protein
MKFLMVFLIALLTGCATSPVSKDLYGTSCSGFKGWEACTAQALKDCPKGFNVVNREESQITQLRSIQYSCK